MTVFKPKALLSCAVVFLSACATGPSQPFDPEADPRIGAEVRRACDPAFSSSGRGYVRVGGRTGFVTGRRNRQYLLVFSSGCGSIRSGGDFPVFRSYGDNCRYRGEPVQTASATIGVTGACTIERIYEWREDAINEEEIE